MSFIRNEKYALFGEIPSARDDVDMIETAMFNVMKTSIGRVGERKNRPVWDIWRMR